MKRAARACLVTGLGLLAALGEPRGAAAAEPGPRSSAPPAVTSGEPPAASPASPPSSQSSAASLAVSAPGASSVSAALAGAAPAGAASAAASPAGAAPAGAAPAGAASAAATPAGAPTVYSGHGVSSVPPEVLARFAAQPLPPAVSRRVQAMLDVRAPGAGQLSPDGKSLFFTWGVTGSLQLWRIDGPLRFPVQLTGGEDRTSLASIAPDGAYLVVQRDRNGEENPGLYWLDPRGGALQEIQHKPGVQTLFEFISDDGQWIYYRSNDRKQTSYALYRFDKATGKREVVFDDDGLWNVLDHRADGRLLLAKEVGSNMAEIFEWTPATRTLTPLLGQGQREDYLAQYSATDGELLVLTNQPSNFRRLYRWTAAGGLVPVTPDQPHDVSSFAIDDARKRVYYTVNDGGYTRLHVLDGKTLQELTLPRLPEADHVSVGSVSRDGRYVTVMVDTGTAPAVSYVLDWSSQRLTQWQLPSAPEIDLGRFVRPVLESYPARDGTQIPMIVRRPLACLTAVTPCPVVVEFHGGPEGQTLPGFSPRAQLWVDAGFVFVQPNVRGSDGYGKEWLHADDGPKRLKVITDIEDAARFIRARWARGGRQPRVGITGGSYGGYSTLVGMTMFAGAYEAGGAVVGMSNLVTFLENTAPYRRILRISEYGDPVRDREALLQLSPVTYVDRVRAPLLVIQGASDPRVPVGEALQIHEALQARNVSSPLIVFADEGHGAAKRTNQVAMLGHLLAFFERELAGPGQPSDPSAPPPSPPQKGKPSRR